MVPNYYLDHLQLDVRVFKAITVIDLVVQW
jgi:hypothetical protein